MTRQELITELEEKKYTEILELIEDAEKGRIDELELAESLGLLYDTRLNDAVIAYLKEQGVEIIYVNEDTPLEEE
ncbi:MULTISPECIES: hypothetical protein [Alteribacter]|uniref:RNA polymerase sigma factor 70 region 1.1 domain-containing protein n=1 Tax=Alteribacter keqinensis TaxID=2483800 RepID=A0A3M7TU94_9BACI|nr:MULTISPECIES: hypothetical protein [Alteribacter]MBM7094591.1 hypothetical protein [Alteribacter salitolerans]RNA69200.1 hypothetical protein EBO34_04420 [Alteribacter keqinensis]